MPYFCSVFGDKVYEDANAVEGIVTRQTYMLNSEKWSKDGLLSLHLIMTEFQMAILKTASSMFRVRIEYLCPFFIASLVMFVIWFESENGIRQV